MNTRVHLARQLIAALQGGDSLLQQSRLTADLHRPFLPVTGKPVQGAHALQLLMSGHTDPRWYTLEQIKELGYTIRNDAPRQMLSFKTRTVYAEASDGGKDIPVVLNRPHFQSIPLFNADVIHGAPSYIPSHAISGESFARQLSALNESAVIHDQTIANFYVQPRDEIHLPPLERFRNENEYLAKLTHEIMHATSHSTRLNRDIGRSITTKEYAREELIAQLSSLLISSETGLPFSAAGHERYIGNWVALLKSDSELIYTVGREAEKIVYHLMERVRVHQNVIEMKHDLAGERPLKKKWRPKAPEQERIYIFVPYEQRYEASKLGARLDEKRTPKQWYILANMDTKPFEAWLSPPLPLTASEIQGQFERACRDYGLDISKEGIEADAKWHHVPVTTSKNIHKRAGAYLLDPVTWHGYIKNHDTGIETQGGWRPDGFISKDTTVSEQYKILQENRAARERQQLKEYEHVSNQCEMRWKKAADAYESFPYLNRKRVPSYGLRIERGYLLIPLVDVENRIWNLQKIPANPNGQKLFEKGGRKKGTFYVLGSLEEATVVVFVEGYATGASIHKATGLPVVVCFDSGNIHTVMEALSDKLASADKIIGFDNDLVTYERAQNTINNAKVREKEPYREINLEDIEAALQQQTPITLDRDYTLKLRKEVSADHYEELRLYAEVWKGEEKIYNTLINNVGKEKALTAAAQYSAKVIAPHFDDPQAYSKGWKDFNDLHVNQGLEHVRFQIGAAVDLVKGKEAAYAVIREGKYNLLELLDPLPDGRYVGQVVAQEGFHAIQDVGRQVAVAHPLHKLDKIPVIGGVSRINYQDGIGQVSENTKAITKERSR